MRPPPFDWTDERVQALRHLWAAGIPVMRIGRQLGTSGNAVSSKAHRLGLPRRESPMPRG